MYGRLRRYLDRTTFAVLIATALALGVVGIGLSAQSTVTASDLERLRDDVFEAGTDLSRLRTGDATLLKALRANLDALRAEVAALEGRLHRGQSVPDAEYVAVRDQLQAVRRTARSERTVTGAGLGPAALAPEPSSVPLVRLEIPDRSRLDVRLLNGLNPATTRFADQIEAATVRDLTAAGRVVVPAGSLMRGTVVRRTASATDPSSVAVRFESVTVDYRTHAIVATTTIGLQRTLAPGALVSVAFAQTPLPPTRLHHLHLNVIDPERSIGFYTRAFPTTTRTEVAGWPAVQSEKTLLLFNTVPIAASAEHDTALWHFGWNSPDVVADYARMAGDGANFFRVPPPSGHLWAPDGNDVEIAPGGAGSGGSGPRAFNHVHLMSAAPLCAAAWYEATLGLARMPSRQPAPATESDCHRPFGPRIDPGPQIHEPNTRMRLDDLALSIYPDQHPERFLASSSGRVLDHIALAYPDVAAVVERLRAIGVPVLRDVHPFGNTKQRAALIEGPDKLLIELVEAEP